MANGDCLAPSAPSSVPPRGAVISAPGVAAARDPHPPGGRDRDEDRDGPSGFGSMATPHRFVRDGDQVAEHHGCRGRGRPRFALPATPGSPACRAIAPGTALARSALPGSAPSGETPRRGPRGSRRFVSATEETPARRGLGPRRAGRVREHGDAAPFRPRWGSDGRASWLPRQGPSSLRSHRDAWKPCEPSIAPGTALARSALPGTPPSGKAPRRGPRGSRRFVSAAEETPGRRGFASAMAGLDSGGRSGTGEPRIRDTIRQNTQ